MARREETHVGLGTLPLGTKVDGWRVFEVLGRGGGGTVYAAEPLHSHPTGRFALKLASRPQDLRFLREVALLQRILHPRIPRLHGHGWWLHPSGLAFPFLVMERLPGLSLYEWASTHAPTSRQMLHVLADVASALQAAHEAGCVHRDVKGENVLVSPQGHGFLIDFGAGDFHGAPTLTEELLPPGTTYYRSPQALRFQWAHRHQPSAHFEPGPADDVYALGVTAYILVTGGAPACPVDPFWEADPHSGPPPPALIPPSALVTVSPSLDALIVRMLHDEPLARGSALLLTQSLLRAASRSDFLLDAPISPRPQPSTPTGRRSSRLASTLRALGLAAAVGSVLWLQPGWLPGAPASAPPAADPVALGDSRSLAATRSSPQPDSPGLARDMPNKPLPGQQLPPCTEGLEEELELTKGQKDTRSCWIKVDAASAACKVKGYESQGGCYVPVYLPPPTQLPQSGRP